METFELTIKRILNSTVVALAHNPYSFVYIKNAGPFSLYKLV